MHKYFIATRRNNTTYWLKTFGQYGEMHFAEWTPKLVRAMKFDDADKAKEYHAKFFSKRDNIRVDRQFDVYGAYSYGLG